MISKIFSKAGVGKASLIIMVLTLLGNVLGLFRDRALAHFLGVGALSDAYYLSFTVPDIILNIFVMGALGGVFIPIFVDSLHKSDEDARKLGNTFLLIITGVVTFMCGLCFIFVPDILHIFTKSSSTWSVEEFNTAVVLFRIMLVYPLLVGVSNTIGCILNAYHHFFSYAISTALYNVGITLSLIFLYPVMGIYAAAVGVLIGFSMHLIIRLIELRYTPFRFGGGFDFSHAGLKRIFMLMPQRIVTLFGFYGVIMGFSLMALQMQEGVNTIRIYAWNFQSMPINLFAISIATAALPLLSKYVTQKEEGKFKEVYGKMLSQILFFALPSTVAMIILSTPIIGAVLGTGKFDADSIAMTALSLCIFSLSIPLESVNHLYIRMFYAMKQVFIPTIASMLFAVVALVFCYLYGGTFGYLVFPVGWGLGSLVQLVFSICVYHMQNSLKGTLWGQLGIEFLKICMASLTMAFVLLAVKWFGLGDVYTVLLSVALGGATYLGVNLLIRTKTASEAGAFFKKKFLPVEEPK